MSPVPPRGVISKMISVNTGSSDRKEWFIKGTEPEGEHQKPSVESADITKDPKITYPPHGLIIALDPDIPSEQQKVFFESNAKSSHQTKWLLNGDSLGSLDMIAWTPVKGDYKLVLTDNNGSALDKIFFQVR